MEYTRAIKGPNSAKTDDPRLRCHPWLATCSSSLQPARVPVPQAPTMHNMHGVHTTVKLGELSCQARGLRNLSPSTVARKSREVAPGPSTSFVHHLATTLDVVEYELQILRASYLHMPCTIFQTVKGQKRTQWPLARQCIEDPPASGSASR